MKLRNKIFIVTAIIVITIIVVSTIYYIGQSSSLSNYNSNTGSWIIYR